MVVMDFKGVSRVGFKGEGWEDAMVGEFGDEE